MRETAGRVKKLSLELGGNAPFIIFDDADVDDAITQLIGNKFRGGGQTCVCANRVYVQSGIFETFADKLAERVEALKVGDGMDEGTDIGPLINQAGFDKVRRHVKDALDKGRPSRRVPIRIPCRSPAACSIRRRWLRVCRPTRSAAMRRRSGPLFRW